jgi:phosphohistidine swiveling domain-containing protein
MGARGRAAATRCWCEPADVAAQDVRVVGGKAANLARMASAGLPVPPFVTLPTPGPPSAWPPGWAEALVARAVALGPWLAVRSSGSAEDGEHRSLAGRFRTCVGVRPDDVVAAVAEVVASGTEADRISVVVQRMVPATASGVLFTIDPRTGSRREAVVEAVVGLGEPLVSGAVSPWRAVVRRPRHAVPGLRGALGRWRARVLSVSSGAQREALRLGPIGLFREVVPPGTVALPEPWLGSLVAEGLRCERVVGGAADVEWAFDGGALWLVQARPITAAPAQARSAPAGPLWTRRFVGERFPHPPTALGWSLVGPALTAHVHYPRASRHWGGAPPFAVLDGHVWVDASVFRGLAFKLPGLPPPAFLAELLPPEEADALRLRAGQLPQMATLSAILAETVAERRWRRFAWSPTDNHRAWRRLVAASDAAGGLWGPPPRDTSEAVTALRTHQRLLSDYVGVHVVSLLLANLGWQAVRGALAAWWPERAASLHAALLTSPQGNATLEVNAALWRLARVASERDLEALSAAEPLSPPFATALDGFLATWGHRSDASWQLAAPRWRDAPGRLVPLLQRARGAPDPAVASDRARAAHADALRALRALPLGRRTAVLALTFYTRRWLRLREEQRAWMERWMARAASDARAAGAALVAGGRLERADQVFDLTLAELAEVAAGGLVPDLAGRAAARAAADPAPPTFRGRANPRAATVTLLGDGVVAASGEGRVRVVRTLQDAGRLAPGDVLVATSVDPAWTAVFPGLAGIVLELGGVLSHGAVVAREYGVPMVVNIDGATRSLREGERVVVDGGQGRVMRLDAEASG